MISNGQNDPSVQGIDISITKLVPRNERTVAKKYRHTTVKMSSEFERSEF
jgi:hypothetical protein